MVSIKKTLLTVLLITVLINKTTQACTEKMNDGTMDYKNCKEATQQNISNEYCEGKFILLEDEGCCCINARGLII